MDKEKIFYLVVALIALGAIFLLLQPQVEDTFAPQPESAWVAIQPQGEDLAVVGPVEIDAGTPFRLHAVVAARARDGELIYYTEAERVVLGGDEIAPEHLRRWDRSRTVKLRWYTVEGRWPYLPLDAESGVQDFQMQEFLRAQWPLSWSVAGEIDVANDDHLEPDRRSGRQRFGTQRFQVRFQLYNRPDDLVPTYSIASWGVDELKEHVEEFPTVTAVLPGAPGPASAVFGLTQLAPPSDPPEGMRERISELAEHRVAFSRFTVLRDQVRAAGLDFGELRWDEVELDGIARWVSADGDVSPRDGSPRDIAPGDLVRVGNRVVVAWQDQDEDGFFDYDDLCFDYVQGAEVRTFGDIFSRLPDPDEAADDEARRRDPFPAAVQGETIVEVARLERGPGLSPEVRPPAPKVKIEPGD